MPAGDGGRNFPVKGPNTWRDNLFKGEVGNKAAEAIEYLRWFQEHSTASYFLLADQRVVHLPVDSLIGYQIRVRDVMPPHSEFFVHHSHLTGISEMEALALISDPHETPTPK